MPETDLSISELAKEAIQKLSKGKKFRKKVWNNGKLNIERDFPYIIVYRIPLKVKDSGTARIVMGESSYAVIYDNKEDHAHLTQFLKEIAKYFTSKYGSFLIIELWSEEGNNLFSLKSPSEDGRSTIETLRDNLSELKDIYNDIGVNIEYTHHRHPPGMPPLLTLDEIKEKGALLLGVKMPRVFKNVTTGDIYPLFFRRFHKKVSDSLRKAIYNFTHIQTTCNINTYRMLGRRSIDFSVYSIDKKLIEIERTFRFLLLVSPVNSESAWIKFKESKFEKPPDFKYRLLPEDPDVLKRKIYNLNIEEIDDPALNFLLRDKREEMDKKLTMLVERNSDAFKYTCISLYKGVDVHLHTLAEGLLTTVPPPPIENGTLKRIDAAEFEKRAYKEFTKYKKVMPAFNSTITVRKDISGLMVSQGNLLIPADLDIPVERMEALIQHEVGTHVLTYHNGLSQPLKQLSLGLAGYEELQEGIAVLSEYLTGGLTSARMRLLAARVIACVSVIGGADFIETFRLLHLHHHIDEKNAFEVATRVHQSGGYIKDVIYLRGLINLLEFLREGGDLELLLIGKMAQKHIPIIKELKDRDILKNMVLTPRYLYTKKAQQRLKKLKEGIILTDLIEKNNNSDL